MELFSILKDSHKDQKLDISSHAKEMRHKLSRQ